METKTLIELEAAVPALADEFAFYAVQELEKANKQLERAQRRVAKAEARYLAAQAAWDANVAQRAALRDA